LAQPSLSNAGGVGLFVNNNLKYSKRDCLCTSKNEFEALWIDIEGHDREITCDVLYRHPKANLEHFTNYLYSVLDKIANENKLLILMGDLNINLLNYETHGPTESFVNTMFTYNFHPKIIQHTRITYHSATLIDNIFVNSLGYHSISGNIFSDLTDHLPNFLIIHKNCSKFSKTNIFKRDYVNFDEASLIDEVSSIDWNVTLQMTMQNYFFSLDSILRLEELIYHNLIKVHSWLSENKLCLNTDKTNYVIFRIRLKK
jgi:hypothetical protein